MARRPDATALRALDEINLPLIAAKAAARAIKHHPIKLSLNFCGLALLFLATGFSPSPEAWAESDALAPPAESLAAARKAATDARDARARFHASRSWLYACSGPCPALRAAADQAEARAGALAAANAEAVAAQKSRLGLFSSVGVGETRDLFWRTFAGGQSYAKRATMWDALFVGMRSMGRDEGLANFVAQMFFRLLANVTVGVLSGCVNFLWLVTTVISSFRAGWPAALVFFALCALAAASFFATAAVVIGSVGAATVVGGAQLLRVSAEAAAREQRARVAGGAGGRRQHGD